MMMDSIAYIAITCAQILLPAFFWIRGILRKRESDMNLAWVIVLALGILRSFSPSTLPIEGINQIGVSFIGMGLVLMVLGLLKKTDKGWKIVGSSVIMMIFGFFLFAMCD